MRRIQEDICFFPLSLLFNSVTLYLSLSFTHSRLSQLNRLQVQCTDRHARHKKTVQRILSSEPISTSRISLPEIHISLELLMICMPGTKSEGNHSRCFPNKQPILPLDVPIWPCDSAVIPNTKPPYLPDPAPFGCHVIPFVQPLS